MVSDKRKRSRVDAGFEVVLACGGHESVRARVKNLSLKGMLCEHEPRLGAREKCRVAFELSQSVFFEIEATVLRNDEQGLALDFEGMDEEAFLHLRNLVRFNSDDPDAIDRELGMPAF